MINKWMPRESDHKARSRLFKASHEQAVERASDRKDQRGLEGMHKRAFISTCAAACRCRRPLCVCMHARENGLCVQDCLLAREQACAERARPTCEQSRMIL